MIRVTSGELESGYETSMHKSKSSFRVSVIIILCGIIPCLISSLLWGQVLYFLIFHRVMMWELIWPTSGAAGLLFFILALQAHIKSRIWPWWYYVLGLWGLCGVLPFVLGVIVTPFLQGFDIIVYIACCSSFLPIFALGVAWNHRVRAAG